MCQTCWQDNGSPKIVNDKVKNLVSLIKNLDDKFATSGCLHCTIDDWNIEDKYLTGGLRHKWSPTCNGERRKLENEIYEFLKTMTPEERASALAIDEEFFNA